LSLPLYLQQEKSGTLLLRLRVQPNASRSGWAGPHGERYRVRLQAPPQDGKANRELLRFLSDALGIPRSNLEIKSGQTSRDKTVRVTGLSADKLAALIPDS
jgi:uncharacterized protein (TIGR00251 family)